MARVVKSVFLTLLVFSLFGFLQLSMVTSAYAAAGDPTVTINNISTYVNSLPTISGTASDDVSVNKVQVRITNNTDSTCWDGSIWQDDWVIQTLDSIGNAGGDTSLALDSSGNPAISYYDSVNTSLEYAHWNGSSWDIQTVDSAGYVGSDTSLAFDSSGNPAISYYKQTDGDLKYACWNGSSWDIQTVDSAGYVGSYTSLAFDSSGNPAISYYDTTDDDLKFARWNGSSWDIQIVDLTSNVGRYTSLAFDSSGNPAISYQDFTNRDLKFARLNGSTWDIQTLDSIGDVGRYTSLAFDSSGNPAISYLDDTNRGLKFARYNGSSWDIELVGIDGDSGWYSSLVFDTSDNPAIACIASGLHYAHWNGESWDIQTQSSDLRLIQWTSLILDSNGNPCISGHDQTDDKLKYVSWNRDAWRDATGTTSWSYTMPSLSDGSYTMRAKATDGAGNTSSMKYDTFIYDATAPATPASFAKTTLENDNTPTFAWAASTDATSGIASYEIKMDDGSWTDVGNVTTYTFGSTVADGSHTLYLRAKDNAGNDSSQASLAFDIDATAPSAPTSVARTTPDTDNTPTFTWSAATDATSGIASYEVKLNTGTWADVGNVTSYTFNSAVSDGSHTLYLRAKDNAGNYSSEASLVFTVDTPPPTIPANLTKASPDTDNTPAFTWNASTAASGIASYEVKLDDGTWINVGNATTYTFSGPLVDGSYTFYARAKDNAEHIGQLASVVFNIDAPNVPNQPTSTSPADEATGVSVTPTLESSAFSDEDTVDTHTASQWQITAMSGQYSSPTWESGTDATNLASIEAPAGNLAKSTTYYWRVRHQDNHGDWSEWSAETSFTTGSGGGGCGASVAAATTESIVSGWGIIGLLSATGVYAHKKRKKR